MEPVIHTGDVIIVRPLAQTDSVQDGDIITFRTKDGGDTIITHRVVGTVNVNGKPKAYVTKGDANDSKDGSVVTPAQILGRYAWRVPYFGYVAAFLRRPVGIFLCLILPGLIIIGTEFRKMYRALEEAEAAKADGGDDGQQTG
ncbi:MAG TPA: signal peptidase I, partial [Symbiobacteriaceae bacterium]|nr:signal peptidase I [Symbiobacteriaceae bacterium]